MPIWAPKNLELKVITNPPIQKITKINTKIELSLLVLSPVDKAILYKKQKSRGPHKSQLYNSSNFLSVILGTATYFILFNIAYKSLFKVVEISSSKVDLVISGSSDISIF